MTRDEEYLVQHSEIHGQKFDCYCPYDIKTRILSVGMNIIGKCPGKCVGEFWPDDKGGYQIKLYDEKKP